MPHMLQQKCIRVRSKGGIAAAPGATCAVDPSSVRVGLCGFTMSMKTYPNVFPVVEVQSTFYEPPDDAVLAKWRETTGDSLEYTVKAWQLVTHAAGSPTYRRMMRPLGVHDDPGFFRDTAAVAEGWRRSVECAQLLSATAMLFQSPASFRPEPENVRNMRTFFERIDRPPLRLLWEPRGPRWTAERDLAIELCRELDLVYVVDPFVTLTRTGRRGVLAATWNNRSASCVFGRRAGGALPDARRRASCRRRVCDVQQHAASG